MTTTAKINRYAAESSRLLQYLENQRSVSSREMLLDLGIGSPTKAIHRLRSEYNQRIATVNKRNPDNARKIIHQILDNIDDRWPEPADPVGLLNTGCRP